MWGGVIFQTLEKSFGKEIEWGRIEPTHGFVIGLNNLFKCLPLVDADLTSLSKHLGNKTSESGVNRLPTFICVSQVEKHGGSMHLQFTPQGRVLCRNPQEWV